MSTSDLFPKKLNLFYSNPLKNKSGMQSVRVCDDSSEDSEHGTSIGSLSERVQEA